MFRLIYYANIPSLLPSPLSPPMIILIPFSSQRLVTFATFDLLCKLMTLLTMENNSLKIHSDPSIKSDMRQFLGCLPRTRIIWFPLIDSFFTFFQLQYFFLGWQYSFSMVESIILVGTHFMTQFGCFARGNHLSAWRTGRGGHSALLLHWSSGPVQWWCWWVG